MPIANLLVRVLGQSVVCGSGREAEAAKATLANWQDACEREEGQEEASGKVIDLQEGKARLIVGILSCGKTARTELDSRVFRIQMD
jgi:hypothetical protein